MQSHCNFDSMQFCRSNTHKKFINHFYIHKTCLCLKGQQREIVNLRHFSSQTASPALLDVSQSDIIAVYIFAEMFKFEIDSPVCVPQGEYFSIVYRHALLSIPTGSAVCICLNSLLVHSASYSIKIVQSYLVFMYVGCGRGRI